MKVEYEMPNAKVASEKLKAYKSHWRRVRAVQDELSKQYIHDNVKIGEVAKVSQLSYATVARFFHFGRYGDKMGYSLFHGPTVTTFFGIASALDMELEVKPKKPNGKGNGHGR